MNKTVRAAVFARAANRCECGCGRHISEETGHLDHFFGRAKAQESVESCWALSVECDARKTGNAPNATYWLVSFALHALKHGFIAEANRALGKTLNLAVKGLAA